MVLKEIASSSPDSQYLRERQRLNSLDLQQDGRHDAILFLSRTATHCLVSGVEHFYIVGHNVNYAWLNNICPPVCVQLSWVVRKRSDIVRLRNYYYVTLSDFTSFDRILYNNSTFMEQINFTEFDGD